MLKVGGDEEYEAELLPLVKIQEQDRSLGMLPLWKEKEEEEEEAREVRMSRRASEGSMVHSIRERKRARGMGEGTGRARWNWALP